MITDHTVNESTWDNHGMAFTAIGGFEYDWRTSGALTVRKHHVTFSLLARSKK